MDEDLKPLTLLYRVHFCVLVSKVNAFTMSLDSATSEQPAIDEYFFAFLTAKTLPFTENPSCNSMAAFA